MNELQLDTQTQKSVCDHLGRIDHLAISVPDLAEALSYYLDVLGFTLESRLETNGNYTGMVSAVVRAAKFSIVLLQGTTPKSQVSGMMFEYIQRVDNDGFAQKSVAKLFKQMEEADAI
ncbi:MAG: VOC family protein [Algicola sp.]|nr:VOC family protein [Algicola sp.]